MRRSVTLLPILLLSIVTGLVNLSCSGNNVETEETVDSSIPDINNPKLKERLGEDDGYAIAVLFGGDIHGSLETCG